MQLMICKFLFNVQRGSITFTRDIVDVKIAKYSKKSKSVMTPLPTIVCSKNFAKKKLIYVVKFALKIKIFKFFFQNLKIDKK